MLKKIIYRLRKIFLILVEKVLIPCLLLLTYPWRALRKQRFLNSPPPQTLIVTFLARGLGDCIYFSGILSALRTHFPSSLIELAVLKQFEPYFRDCPSIDRILDCPDYSGNLQSFERFMKSAFSRRSEGCVDLLIDFLPNHMLMPSLWRMGIRTRYSIGIGDSVKSLFYDEPVPILWKVHFLDAIFAGLSPLRITRKQPSFWIPPDSDVTGLLPTGVAEKSLVIIAPGGRRNVEAPKDYCWYFKEFPQLINELTERGYQVLMTGAPYDLEFTHGVISRPNLIDLVGKTSLLQVFTLVKRFARLVVCNNSGLLHIASTCGVSTISYADPQENMTRWCGYPSGPMHIFHQDQPDQLVTLDDMLNEVLKKLEN